MSRHFGDDVCLSELNVKSLSISIFGQIPDRFRYCLVLRLKFRSHCPPVYIRISADNPMFTYILGPFLALLPKPWREASVFSQCPQPARAAAVSGLAESIAAILALGNWYMYAMTNWASRGTEAALAGKLGPLTDQEIAGFALSLWATHPLTWSLGYLVFEGVVRLCAAAFTGGIFGILPLFLFDKLFCNPFRRSRPRVDSSASFGSNISSLFSAVQERLMVARLSEVPDQLRFRKSNGEEFLEIFASRRKSDWTAPRVVRYREAYFRLELCTVVGGPRPFRYTLRRLPAGVSGRSVLLYLPGEVHVVQ